MNVRPSHMARPVLTAVAALLVTTLAACTSGSDERPDVDATAQPSVSLPTSSTVKLVMGHCWIEYLDLDGETWSVTKADRFGGGDSESVRPYPSRGTGQVTQIGDNELLYVDDAGAAKLTLVPRGDVRAFKIEGKACA